MDIYIGSSSESSVGVGTLLKWNHGEVRVDYDPTREEGGWRVEDRDGQVWYCHDMMRLFTPGFDPIEQVNLDGMKF